jgi:uncharacterized protein
VKHGIFGWNELVTKDVDAAKAFYAATFGWTFEPMRMGMSIYWVAKSEGRLTAGITYMGTDEAGATPHWFSYILVDDMELRIGSISENGGKVHRPPMFIPGVGHIAIITDPSGASVGLLQRG